ncbi:hypothetical protein HDU97_002579 [Phlyctochytrium planicorne]|nr:hypothetical protein HDU97_002579 [Phlyctochytrium planicorne]
MKTTKNLVHNMNWLWFLALVVFAVSASAAAGDKVRITQIEIWHAVGSGPFTKRGSTAFDPEAKKKITLKYDGEAVQPESLLKSYPQDELYRVQWRYVNPVFGSKDVTLTASIRLCLLQSAKFEEFFTVHIDQAGLPFHLDYVVNAATCENSNIAKKPFKSQVTVARTWDGSRPRLEMIHAQTKDGKPEAEKTFFQKYWYYIVAVVLILLMTGGDEGGKK